MAANSVNVC